MTNKINITITTSTLLLLLSFILQSKVAVAAAQGEGLYISGNVGVGVVPKIKANGLNVPHDIAYSTSAAIGNKVENVRYEGELGYTQAANNDFVGRVNALKWMTNLLYDFDDFGDNNFSGITPYLGAGIGWARISNTTPKNNLSINDNDKVTTKSTRFAYQAMGGFGYHITDNISSRAYYRYFSTTKLNRTNSSFQEHSFNVALSYTFGK